ncbi:MAG: hypothetical protein M1839_003510 [Geoglossum umbratile]|nr:MAG: hypothetical protein M1839_003510 [Geoglossum umbratile]
MVLNALCRSAILLDNAVFAYSSAALVIFLSILTSTFLFTSLRFRLKCLGDMRLEGKEPPTLPYWIPFIGSSLGMMRNPHGFYKSAMFNVQTIFRNSRDLAFEWFNIRVLQSVLGMPLEDARKLEDDRSGSAAVPLSEGTGDGGRIWRRLLDIFHTTLSGNRIVASMTDRFVGEFGRRLDDAPAPILTPLYRFLWQHMFDSSTVTLVGPRVLEEHPTFAQDFWDFDERFITLLYGTPRFLCRRGWGARDRCLAATRRYLKRAWEGFEWEDEGKKGLDWEVNFGNRALRLREQALAEYGISLDGRASLEFGMIWALAKIAPILTWQEGSINSNAIPVAGWMLIEILQDPDLHQRVRAEVMTVVLAPESEGDSAARLDPGKLADLPLLKSIYMECLRLYASIPLTRMLRTNMDVDGYTLRAGNFILAPSYLAHYNEDAWSTPGHPAHTFWAERFLRKGNETTKVASGDFFPYGGGLFACPGRHFAKQELLAAVALMLIKFDFEFIGYVDRSGNSSTRGPKFMEHYESGGVVQPDRDLLVRIHRV